MSLRLQLLAFGLVTLVLPWTGLRYVREMEAALRAGVEQSLIASATTVAAALEEQGALPGCGTLACGERTDGAGAPIYATPLRSAPVLDGSSDDWDGGRSAPAVWLGPGQSLYAGTYGRFAYFHITVDDEDLVYQRLPGESPYGDRVVLALPRASGGHRWLLLVTGAPGAFRAQETASPRFESTGRYDERVLAAWQETRTGYAIEVRVPSTMLGEQLGVAVIDVDRRGAEHVVETSATWDLERGMPGRFVRQDETLQSLVTQFGRAGGRFRVLDHDGFVIADAGSASRTETVGASGSLLAGLLRFALQREDPPYPPETPPGRVSDPQLRRALEGSPATGWYGVGTEGEALVAAAVPFGDGVVLVERASEPVLTLTDAALARLMGLTLLASLLAAAGLFAYATWLSLRVRRLARAAESALGPKGEIDAAMPGRGARDELGDLARSFSRLLARLREHTEYLRTLRSKLSHELRTPLAVVTTSLENLEHEVPQAQAGDYLARLKQGASRLDAIVAAMSEATELEHAVKSTRAERFDLAAVVAACCDAYRDVYAEREIVYVGPAEGVMVDGSGELIAQLLDKLIDNAVGFSPPGSRILVKLDVGAPRVELSITNKGPRLPEQMRGRLFDSLVSVRPQRDARPHLGLGLHIVALITEFHRGEVAAEDLADGSGVIVRVTLPRARAGSA